MSKGTRKAVTLTISLRPDEAKLVKEMAARSELPLEKWLALAVTSAAYVDRAHWEELAECARIKSEIAADRGQFDRLSAQLRNLSDGCFNVLVDHMVAERESLSYSVGVFHPDYKEACR